VSHAPELLAALEAREARITREWEEDERAYLFAEGPSGKVFGRSSSDPGDFGVFVHEGAVRRLVGADGPALRCPPVLDSGREWSLEAVVEPRPLRGAAVVDAAVAAVGAIMERTDLPALEAQGRTGAGRLRAVSRRLRTLASPLALRDMVAAKRTLADPRLPEAVSHGDFHAGNLLWDGEALWVIDWELLDRRGAGHDLLSLWPTLEDAADRERLFEGCVGLVGEEHRQALARLRHAITVLVIAGKLAPARAFNADREGAQRLLALLPDLRREAGL
jgi:hypothetical protein